MNACFTVSTIVKVNIEIVNIVTIEASFSQILPALFVYINDKAAINVREALGFNNDSNAYLDPWSTGEFLVFLKKLKRLSN